MSKPIGVLTRIWTNFRNSFGVRKQITKLVGEDHDGNKYFEKEEDSSRNLRAARYVEPKEGDQFTVPDIPVEWGAWLQRRRKFPPTQEEIDRNYVQMLKTQKRAEQLEEKYTQKKMLDEGPTTAEQKEASRVSSTVSPESSSGNYTIYPDMELKPGQHEKWQQKEEEKKS